MKSNRDIGVMTSYLSKATLNKKLVSCPAGGRNCGQSGGHKIFFSPFFFCKKMMIFLKEKKKKKKKRKKKKKSSHSAVIKLTRPLDRKQHFFKGWPNLHK